MDIFLTDGDDVYVQSPAKIDEWNSYFGKAGNDSIKIYQGGVLGGAGNDRIERLPSTEWWRTVAVNYWESPGAIVVDLAAGTASDGYGTVDTLIGVRDINGGWNGATLYGDAQDNEIGIGGGDNVVDGRAGADLLRLPVFNDSTDLGQFKIVAAIDGLSATITRTGEPGFKAVVSNIEWITVGWDQPKHAIAEFIKPQEMAEQGLLGADANRWNAGAALGSAVEISFSFVGTAPASGPGASGFAAFTEAQRAAVRAILDSVAQLTGASFRETADGAAVNLRFGASQQANTKGLAALPGEAGAGAVWMDIESLQQLAPGSEGYAALLHEIGHALGLRHPRNVEPGEAWSAQWRAADDTSALSVMAQGASADGLFPSSFSGYDIAALRVLYGSRGTASANTSYVLDGLRFSSQTSITDDGGIDSIDAALAVAGVALNLVPGQRSSVGITGAGIGASGNLTLGTDTWIENARGSAFDDVIKGNALDNLLTGGKGNDWIDGAAGIDTAVFEGLRSDYLISTGFGKVFLTARDGVSGFDTLLGIEKLAFKDLTLTLGASALGADATLEVDQGSSVSGRLPAPSDIALAKASYQLAQAPAYGSLTLGADGSYSYTPRAGFSGADLFGFTLKDQAGVSNSYLAYVSVRATSASASVVGSDGADTLAGSSGNDLIDAGAGNDRITASLGNDVIHGGSGRDTLVVGAARAAYSLSASNGLLSLTKPSGIDTLDGIERIVFSDGALAFDVDGTAGQTYLMYQAAFNRKPDAGGLGFWIANMDAGMARETVAANFMTSAEFISQYGANPSAEQFVAKLYDNVLHRPYEQGGFDFWVAGIKAGIARSTVLVQFAESGENVAALIGTMQLGMDYLPFG